MYVDSRTVDDGAVVDTDLCVVGAGAAGITLALQLAGGPFRVTLVESGGLEPGPESEALKHVLNVGRPYPHLDYSRMRYFGGSTNCWGGHCLPLRPIDFEPRPWVPDSGWPITRADLEPSYVRAHEVIGLGAFDYDAERLLEEAGASTFPFDPRRIPTVVSRYNARRFGLDYHETLDRIANLTTYLWGNMVGVRRHPTNAYVESIDVRTVAGNGYSVRARHFVLALGGIENARMLLLSNDVEPAGLGNGHDLVGRYFMEHIRYRSGVILPAAQHEILTYYDAEMPLEGDVAIRAHLAASEELERELQIPAFRSEFVTSYGLRNVDALEAADSLRQDVLAGRWPDEVGDDLLTVLTGLDDIAGYFVGSGPPLGYRLKNYVEQTPNPDSRIGLSHERDMLGLRRATVDWRLSALDREGIARAQRVIAAEVGRTGFGRMRIDLDGADPDEVILEGADGGAHHMGTTRMHDDPRRGVVDADCRVHGLANLFVVGGSVFPNCGYANPTLTIVAVSVRLADHLRAVITS